jgi:hypothetical protein
MYIRTSWISPGLFAAILFCFFLPFIDVKCNDALIGEVHGMELITGEDMFDNPRLPDAAVNTDDPDVSSQIDRNYFAIVAWGLALCGLVINLTLLARKAPDSSGKEMLLGFIGLAGILCMLLMKMQIENRVRRDAGMASQYVIHLDLAFGYWITLVLFVLVAFMNINSYMQQKRNAVAAAARPHPEETSG